MSPDIVIGEKAAGGWRPAPRFFGVWRTYPPRPALQPRMLFAGKDRRATAQFVALWRHAFGASLSLVEPLIEPDGRPTRYFAGLL